MTSKKALLKIESFCVYEDFQEELNAIAKDLEVLETIKKYCDIELFYEFAFNRYLLSFTEKDKTKNTFDTPISKEDAEKIMKYFDYLKAQDSMEGKVKEVLDNEK